MITTQRDEIVALLNKISKQRSSLGDYVEMNRTVAEELQSNNNNNNNTNQLANDKQTL